MQWVALFPYTTLFRSVGGVAGVVVLQAIHVFQVKGERTFAAVDFELDAVLAAGSEPQERHPTRNQRRSEEHTSELQSHHDLVCRLLLEKKKKRELTEM